MGEKNSNFDSKVKGLSDKSILTIHDFLDLDNAVYVSKRDNVESIDKMSGPKKYDESVTDKKFYTDKYLLPAEDSSTHRLLEFGDVSH